MEIRKINKEDLPTIVKLCKSKKLDSHNGICYKHSKMCIDENGIITAFIVLVKSSILDYYGGEIPKDNSINPNEVDYEEGEEFWLKDIALNNEHYEIVASYLKVDCNSIVFTNLLHSVEGEDGKQQIGIIWSKKNLPVNTNFYLYNNEILINMPIEE